MHIEQPDQVFQSARVFSTENKRIVLACWSSGFCIPPKSHGCSEQCHDQKSPSSLFTVIKMHLSFSKKVWNRAISDSQERVVWGVWAETWEVLSSRYKFHRLLGISMSNYGLTTRIEIQICLLKRVPSLLFLFLFLKIWSVGWKNLNFYPRSNTLSFSC